MQSRDSQQVQLTLLNALLTKILVDYVLGHVERLRSKSELTVHVNNPLYQEGTRSILYLRLHLLEITRVD